MTVTEGSSGPGLSVAASLAAAAPALRRPRARARAPHVTTVLLASDGATWLPRTLAALSAQRRPSDVVVTVDADSRDDSERQLLTLSRRLPDATVRHVRVSAAASVLDAAQAALAVLDADRLDDDAEGAGGAEAAADHEHLPARPGAGPLSWVWLLHDDSAPEPDALERLLEAVEVAPHVAIAGVKLTDWDDRRRLLEIGVTASRRGRVIGAVERGESDQGQRDDVSDVLAVSSAGMLVRADVLVGLGGDPSVPRSGEALDLCRRAHLAGHRVVVVPQAVVHHADATATGARRPGATGGGSSHRRRARAVRAAVRRDEVHHQLVTAPLLALPLVVALTAIGAVLRALGRMATKQPSLAPAEITAVASAQSGLLRPGGVWRSRATWRLAAPAHQRGRGGDGRRALAALQPGTVELFRFHRDRLARGGWSAREGYRGAPGGRDGRGDPRERAAGEGAARASGDDPLPFAPPSRIGRLAVPLVLLALAGTSAWVLRGLLEPGQVTGPALPGAPSLGATARALVSDWSPAGLGAALPPDPLLWVVAAASLPLLGDVSTAVAALLLLALPLAGWGGWAAAGLATRSRPLRLLAALVWASAPPLLLGLDSGRLGAVVAHVALPWAVLGGVRALTAPSRRSSLVAAASGGLAAGVAVAGAPVLVLALLVAVVAAAFLAPRWRASLVWVLAPSAVLVAPLAVVAATDPRALLAGPGFALASAVPAWWQLVLGQPQAPGAGWLAQLLPGSLPVLAERAGQLAGTVPGAVGGALSRAVPPAITGVVRWVPLALPAAALLTTGVGAWARRRTGAGARAGWVLVAVGVVLAALCVHTAVAPPAVTAWPGAGTSLVWLGAAAGALVVAERTRTAVLHPARPATATRRRVARSRWRTPTVVLAGVVALAPLGALAGWAAASPSQLQRGSGALPAVALDAGRGPDAARTLELDLRDLRADPAGASASATLARGRVTLLDTSAAATAAALEGPLLGQATATAAEATSGPGAAPEASGTALLRSVSAALAAGSGDPGPALRSLGIGFVFVRGDSPLDGSTALVRAGATDDGVLYRVATDSPGAVDRPARARLLDQDGTALGVLPSAGERVSARIDPGPPGRSVVLAERYDPRWRATLDGQPLAVSRADGWATAVDVPAGGGELVVSHAGLLPLLFAVAQAVVLLLTVLLALPLGGAARYRGAERRAAS